MGINEIWLTGLEKLIKEGQTVPTRQAGQTTTELISNQLIIPMDSPILSLQERKINYNFLAGGALWHITGMNDINWLAKYSKRITKFYDSRFAFGSYGPRIISQLPYILQTLKENINSRQAVINIWNESPHIGNKDTSCLLSLHFLIRNNTINTVVSMRSSDYWLGLPYDIFDFSIITAYIVLLLGGGLKLGNLYFNAGSSHLYSEYYDKAKLILRTTKKVIEPSLDIDFFENDQHLKDWLLQMAESGGLSANS